MIVMCYYQYPPYMVSKSAAAPEITTVPQSQIIAEGDDESFTCTASGSPVPVITWTHNDRPIKSSGIKYSIDEPEISTEAVSSTLTLHQAGPLDSGKIKCIATIEDGADTGDILLQPAQETAQLSVLGMSRSRSQRLIFLIALTIVYCSYIICNPDPSESAKKVYILELIISIPYESCHQTSSCGVVSVTSSEVYLIRILLGNLFSMSTCMNRLRS